MTLAVLGLLALMWATSRSGMSQPAVRAVPAMPPVTMLVQLPPLASIHWPDAFLRTTRLWLPGIAGLLGFIGGLKPVPALGTGTTPPYGPAGLATSLGMVVHPPCGEQKPPAWKVLPGITVVWLPLSKKAAYTVLPSGLTASARGCSPFSSTSTGALFRLARSKACTLSRSAQLTKAFSGEPANTTSAGSFSVATLRTVAFAVRSTMLISSLTWHTTHASLLLRTRTVTGSRPTGMVALCAMPAGPTV